MPLKPLFKLKNESIWSIFGESCVEKPMLRPSWNATIESGFCHHCLLRHNCPSNVLFSHNRGYRELQTAHQKSPGSSAAPRGTHSRRHQLLSAQLGQQNMWRVLSVVVKGGNQLLPCPWAALSAAEPSLLPGAGQWAGGFRRGWRQRPQTGRCAEGRLPFSAQGAQAFSVGPAGRGAVAALLQALGWSHVPWGHLLWRPLGKKWTLRTWGSESSS